MPMKGRKCLTIILIIGGVVMFLWTSFLLTSFSYYHYYHQSSSPSPRRSFSALINTDLIHIDYPSGFKSDISSKSIDKDDKIFFLVNTSTKDPSLSQTSLILSSHEYSGPIFVDWIRPSYHFNNINYKSMESLLITYPHSNIQMTVIGPQSANYYKLGDLMRSHLIYHC